MMMPNRRRIVHAAILATAMMTPMTNAEDVPERGDLPSRVVPEPLSNFRVERSGNRLGDNGRMVIGVPPDTQKVLADTIGALCAFGTRHTMSETESDTRGIGAARRWVAEQFRQAGERVVVTLEPNMIEADGRRILEPVKVVNVICEIPGSMPEAKGRRYYMLAHLDSRNSGALDAEGDSPGANDDASGVAAMIEIAHTLARMNLDSTVVLVATSGEEQGLHGARAHVNRAVENGWDVRGVLNNDTIGDPYGPWPSDSEEGREARGLIRIFSQGIPTNATPEEYRRLSQMGAESDSSSRQLARFVDFVARWHDTDVKPMLVFRNDRFLRGGDHTPFVEAGFPGVRFTVPYEDYDRQHQDVRTENGTRFGDTAEWIDAWYLAEVTKLNALTLIHLANAPSVPRDARIITADLGNDTEIRWSPSPEPDVAGYEVVARRTTSPQWERSFDVRADISFTTDLHKDNWFFGVRAYDKDGYRSPVAFCGTARE